MSHEEFIEAIAKEVKSICPKYNIFAFSAVIAQACLESGYGTSDKAKHHNYFGLKYREGRVSCNKGYFNADSSEQLADGSYVPITTDWYAFEDMSKGIEGYCQFLTNANRYSKCFGVSDPRIYLQELKDAGYATSLDYVDNIMRCLHKNNLEKFDKKEEKDMSDIYDLVYQRESNKHYGFRNKIDTITIHCYVGQVTAKQGVDYLCDTQRKASVNLVCGTDGVGSMIPLCYGAWTSSSETNDMRAVTIETACDTEYPYAVSDKVLNRLIHLIADVCKKVNIPKLVWSNNKDDRVNHRNGCNMTLHRDFAATACPGDYLVERMQYIADEVNKLLNGVSPQPAPKPTTTSKTEHMYRVRLSWDNIKSQIGAYKSLDNAKKACKEGYKVFDENGNVVYSNIPTSKPATESSDKSVILNNTPCYTSSNSKSPYATKSGKYFYWSDKVVNGKIRITNSKDKIGVAGQVTCWINANGVSPNPSPSKPAVDIDALARAVIRGDYGSGQERKNKLGDLYSAVQDRVNEMLGKR